MAGESNLNNHILCVQHKVLTIAMSTHLTTVIFRKRWIFILQSQKCLHACEVNSSPYDQLRFHHAPILELCREMNSHMKRSASVHIDIGNFQPLHLISASLDFEIGNIQRLVLQLFLYSPIYELYG